MTAKEAQAYISTLEKRYPPTKDQIKAVKHLKVNYNSLEEMPTHTQERIKFAVDYIVKRYDPPYVDLVRGYLDGYPVDETVSIEDFYNLKKVKPSAKFSDYDFLVPTIPTFQKIEQIAPLILIDLFKEHLNCGRRLRLYTKYIFYHEFSINSIFTPGVIFWMSKGNRTCS